MYTLIQYAEREKMNSGEVQVVRTAPYRFGIGLVYAHSIFYIANLSQRCDGRFFIFQRFVFVEIDHFHSDT